MYWWVGGDLPALRAEFRKVATELYVFHSDLNVADAQLRSALSEQAAREKAAREAITSSLHALGIGQLVLAQKAEGRPLRPQEAKALLSAVRDISIAEAQKLESITTVGGVIPQEHTPLLALANKDAELKELATFFGAATPSTQPAYLGRLLLTRNGTWRAADREILFKWHGGSARLRATKDLPQAEILRKAELFNAVSLAISQAYRSTPLETAARAVIAPQPLVAPRAEPVPRSKPAPVAARQPQRPARPDVLPSAEAPLRRSPSPAP